MLSAVLLHLKAPTRFFHSWPLQNSRLRYGRTFLTACWPLQSSHRCLGYHHLAHQLNWACLFCKKAGPPGASGAAALKPCEKIMAGVAVEEGGQQDLLKMTGSPYIFGAESLLNFCWSILVCADWFSMTGTSKEVRLQSEAAVSLLQFFSSSSDCPPPTSVQSAGKELVGSKATRKHFDVSRFFLIEIDLNMSRIIQKTKVATWKIKFQASKTEINLPYGHRKLTATKGLIDDSRQEFLKIKRIWQYYMYY